MKKCLIAGLLLGSVFSVNVFADEGAMRTFTTTDGRSIELSIVKYDASHGAITVERADGQRLTVKISMFSEDDRLYIKEWVEAQELLSDKNIRCECDDNVVEERKEEITRYGTEISGGGVSSSVDIPESELLADQQMGGSTRTVVGKIEYEKTGYVITFENRSDQKIEGARIEYQIFYEQGAREVDAEIKQLVFSGSGALDPLLPGKKIKFSTDAVEVRNENMPGYQVTTLKDGSEEVGGLDPAEGDIHGIRWRLIAKTASGKEVVREFKYPSTLSDKKLPWKSEE